MNIPAFAAGTRQQHELLCEQDEGIRHVVTHQAAVPPSVGRGRRTTTPAWMTMGTGGTAHAPRKLQQQQQPSNGARQEEVRPSAIVATRTVAALRPVGRGGRTTAPAWMMRGSTLVTGGLQ